MESRQTVIDDNEADDMIIARTEFFHATSTFDFDARHVSTLNFSPRRSDGKNKERDDDERYHMGTYGTFMMDSIQGRVFELEAFTTSQKFHTLMYFIFTVIAIAMWPFAPLLALVVGAIAGDDKDLRVFKVILLVAFCLGTILWMTPAVIVAKGGASLFLKLIHAHELNATDFVEIWLAMLILLLSMIYAMASAEIAVDVEEYKRSAKASWARRQAHQDEFGHAITCSIPEAKRLHASIGQSHPEGDPVRIHTHISLQDVMRVLESLPGWHTPVTARAYDHAEELVSKRSGLNPALGELADEAAEKDIWPLDIWLVRDQWLADRDVGLMTSLTLIWRQIVDMMTVVKDEMENSPASAVLLVMLATIRAFIPRLWLWIGLEGEFWPTDAFGPPGRVVAYTTFLSFLVSLNFLGIVFYATMRYRCAICQLCLLAALADARQRVRYSQSFLLSFFWFGLGPDEAEAVLAKLPLLDLRVSANVAAFWRLISYSTLDRAKERMAISVLVEIVVIWLVLKFLWTIAVLRLTDSLPALLMVTLFDLLVFGGMILMCLQGALSLRGTADNFKQTFVESKYQVTMALGNLRPDDPHYDSLYKDLAQARRLLIEYLDVANEVDRHDKILFGMAVTPNKIISSFASVALLVCTLMAEMIRKRQIHVSSDIRDHVKDTVGTVALAIVNHTMTW